MTGFFILSIFLIFVTLLLIFKFKKYLDINPYIFIIKVKSLLNCKNNIMFNLISSIPYDMYMLVTAAVCIAINIACHIFDYIYSY